MKRSAKAQALPSQDGAEFDEALIEKELEVFPSDESDEDDGSSLSESLRKKPKTENEEDASEQKLSMFESSSESEVEYDDDDPFNSEESTKKMKVEAKAEKLDAEQKQIVELSQAELAESKGRLAPIRLDHEDRSDLSEVHARIENIITVALTHSFLAL